VARGVDLLDVTAGTGVYIKQMGAALNEIVVERPADDVAAIEVRADRVLLVDGVTGTSPSRRRAVRSAFARLGLRQFSSRRSAWTETLAPRYVVHVLR
jgi:hypothetical protein